MEISIDERRTQQQALGVQGFMGGAAGRTQAGRDLGDEAVLNRHAHRGATVGQGGVVDQEVEHVEKRQAWFGSLAAGAARACAPWCADSGAHVVALKRWPLSWPRFVKLPARSCLLLAGTP